VIVSTRNVYGWPLRHRSTQVELDGEPIRTDVPVRSFPGVHTVSLKAELEVPCGLFPSDAARLRVADRRVFAMSEGAVSVFVRVRDDGDPIQRLPDRLRVDWEFVGAQAADVEVHFPRECAGLAPVLRARCRVSAERESRRVQRDVVGVLCTTHVLGALQLLGQAPDRDADLAEKAGRLEIEGVFCPGALPQFLPQRSVEYEDRCAPLEAPDGRTMGGMGGD
jgi:hypothetical protein